MSKTGNFFIGDMYSRQQSGPGGPGATSGPPNMSQSSSGSNKPTTDYSNYATSYGTYSADQSSYGAPPRSYGSDVSSQPGGYASQPPNAGAKHFNDFKEWPSSWQLFDNVCVAGVNGVPEKGAGCGGVYYGGATQAPPPAPVPPTLKDGLRNGVQVSHVDKLNNMSMCYNSWKRVGLIDMKRAGIVATARFNYND